MTILTIDRKEFEKRVGKVTAEMEKRITDMGTPGDQRSRVVGGGSLALVGGGLTWQLGGFGI